MTPHEKALRLRDTDSDEEAERLMGELMNEARVEIADQAKAVMIAYLAVKGRDEIVLPRLVAARSRRFNKAMDELVKICK